MRMLHAATTPLLILVVGLSSLHAANPVADGVAAIWPGTQQDGSVLLPNQWTLHPVGKQIELGDFPVNIAIQPGGKFAAVLHSGYGRHEIIVVELKNESVVSRTPVHVSFYGLEFSADGKTLYCSGAGDETIHCFAFANGTLSRHRELRLRDPDGTGVPAGLAVRQNGEELFAANVWGQTISRVSLTSGRVTEIRVATNAPRAMSTLPSSDFDVAAAEKRAKAAEMVVGEDDGFPYACRIDDKRDRLYVTLWAQAAVQVIDLKSNELAARWATEEHPCEMALPRSGDFLFVANANRNTVSVIDTATGKTVETIWAAFTAQALPGSTPNSIALSPDDKTLFVANANVNAVAVFDVTFPGRSRSLGFIPVGWYPTSVRVTPDGRRLLVANGKGVVAMANPQGPQPEPGVHSDKSQYIGGLFRGTLDIIQLPRGDSMPDQMAAWTRQVYSCVPRPASPGGAKPRGLTPVPRAVGGPSPIRYCIYIIKENRTYDQVFGDLERGNGDPALCLFPERVTPNHHKLAREFVTLDNFYADAEVSAGGHEWSMGAYATDFVEKTWRLNYGHAGDGKFPYPGEGNFAIAAPSGGYLWDRAREAGVSYRSYGEFINNRKVGQPGWTRVKTLEGHFDEWFRSFDLNYSDLKRADRFIAELHRFETNGEMPRLQIVRLPNDHTEGAASNALTPTSFVAQNDLALGRVVEAVSHSKFWPQTAIFVVEDDAQNGPDHVDAHRTVALVISPYVKRSYVDSTLYSTTSMLHTMELVLGLKPMTQFDAAAEPMFDSFQSSLDLTPFEAVPANVDLEQHNQASAWGSRIRMDFTKEDAADDALLNEVVWRSVRGADSPMPAPIRAAFVRTRAVDDD